MRIWDIIKIPLIIGVIAAVVIFERHASKKEAVKHSTPTAEDKFIAEKIEPDPYYKGLTETRKSLLRQTIQTRLIMRNLMSETVLRPDDVRFLKEKGVMDFPEYPGYHSYLGENGIITLIPDEEFKTHPDY